IAGAAAPARLVQAVRLADGAWTEWGIDRCPADSDPVAPWRPHDVAHGSGAASRIRHRAEHQPPSTARLCLSAGRIPVDAAVGVVSGHRPDRARTGVRDAALRPAAARRDPDQLDVRHADLPLAAGKIENRLGVPDVLYPDARPVPESRRCDP